MDLGRSLSRASRSSSSSSSQVSAKDSSSSLLERRNRRRSSAISGPNPAEVPLTESDQRLADTIASIKLQNAREAKRQIAGQPLPPLVIQHLKLSSDSALEEPYQANEKTPTLATFRPLSTNRFDQTVIRTTIPDGNQSRTTFHLFSIPDTSEQNTPTQHDRKTSPIRVKKTSAPFTFQAPDQLQPSPKKNSSKQDCKISPLINGRQFQLPLRPKPKLSFVPASALVEHELSQERSPTNSDCATSPYRVLTRRMYTNSPLSSHSSSIKDKKTERVSPGGKANLEVQPGCHSPCEPFPPLEEN